MKSAVKLFACAMAVTLAVGIVGCSSGSASSSASSTQSQSAAVSSSASDVVSSASASATPTSDVDKSTASLENGVYKAKFDTDSSMFHVNEAMDGRGELTVTDDGMTIHVTLVSKKIVNLYAGTAEAAQSDEAGVIQPTTDSVTYSDGQTEEVYGFDIPVPAIGEEFDVALLGEKGTWYDHKVIVSDPVSI